MRKRCGQTKLIRTLRQLLQGYLVLSLALALGLWLPLVPAAFAESATPLPKAVERGDVEVKAKGNGNYSDISLSLKNRTDEAQSVDINGIYFTPPEGSSSQRLGVSHLVDTNGDSVVKLGPKESKDVKAKAFCIDSTSGVPGYNEDFTLGGEVDDLDDRPFLSEILKWFKNNPSASQYEVQEAIWSVETHQEGGLNSHYGEVAAGILEQVTGDRNPVEGLIELDETKEDTATKATTALGVSLSSLLAAGALSSMSGQKIGGLSSLWNGLSGLFGGNSGPKSEQLIQNLSVDSLTETILGQGEDLFKTPELDKDGKVIGSKDTTLSKTWKNMGTALGIFSDANALHQDGYDDNALQSVGLSTLMNLGTNKAMDALADYGLKGIGTIETFAKLFTPASAQDILPSNIIKQTIKAGGDVTKAVAQALGSGDMEPLNKYAQDVADGKSGLMLSGYAHLGGAAGDFVSALGEKGFVKTISDFGADLKDIVTSGALQDVISEGANKLAAEAKGGSGADRGIAELSEVAGHVIGTLESKGVVGGAKELAGTFVDDVKTIVSHGDFKQISEDVGESAEKATGIIGTGVKEAASTLGEYYEEGGGVIGGAKKFGSDVALIWKYLW